MNTEIAHTYLKNEVAHKSIYHTEIGTQFTSATITSSQALSSSWRYQISISYDDL